jgi:hypothetical protein
MQSNMFLVVPLIMQMEKDWLQFQMFNLSVTNAFLKHPRCKRGRGGILEIDRFSLIL